MPRRAGRSSFPSSSFRRGARLVSVLVQLPFVPRSSFLVLRSSFVVTAVLDERPTTNELLLRSLLLAGDGALARSLAGARIGLRPLPAGGHAAAMAHAAVAV